VPKQRYIVNFDLSTILLIAHVVWSPRLMNFNNLDGKK